MQIERRWLGTDTQELEIELRDGGLSSIRGMAAVYYDGTPRTEFRLGDRVVERIMPGAFSRMLQGGDEVVALFNHDDNQVLGRRSSKTLRLFDDERGLRYSIVTPNTTLGRDLVEQIQRGDIKGNSFSFTPNGPAGAAIRAEGDIAVRELRDLNVFDVGPVTFPAYEATSIYLRSAFEAAGKIRHLHRHTIDPSVVRLKIRALELSSGT